MLNLNKMPLQKLYIIKPRLSLFLNVAKVSLLRKSMLL
jgi:hypothetical protein